MAELSEIVIQADDDTGWKDLSRPGAAVKILWENEETGFSIALFKVAKGSGVPSGHVHASNQFMFCLKGRYRYTASDVPPSCPAGPASPRLRRRTNGQ